MKLTVCLVLPLFCLPSLLCSEIVVSIASKNYTETGVGSGGARLPPNSRVSNFLVDVDHEEVAVYDSAVGLPLSSVAKYEIKGRRLLVGSQVLCSGTSILAQAKVDRGDIVVLQRGSSSFSSPLKIFKGLSGHPVQIEEIWLIFISDRKVKWQHLLQSIESSQVVFEGKLFTRVGEVKS